MKRFGFLFSVIMIMMAIVFNSCKKEDDSVLSGKNAPGLPAVLKALATA
jgi:hypothetical protein